MHYGSLFSDTCRSDAYVVVDLLTLTQFGFFWVDNINFMNVNLENVRSEKATFASNSSQIECHVCSMIYLFPVDVLLY